MESKKKIILWGVGVVLVIVASVCFAFAFGLFPVAKPSSNAVNLSSTSKEQFSDVKETTLNLEDNPIDFKQEMEKYPDMYAWLRVSGTDVDFPILQHPLDDNFYLDHNADGEPDDNGAIYTQMCNSKDMQDPVTVVYGHNMNLSGAMLNQLLLFEDKEFFDNNEYFEIYTPGHIYRYRIISAYAADDRHIMNSFDFSNKTIRMQYFDSVCNPHSLESNVRDGATLNEDDKIVQISTCMGNVAQADERFILTGVLSETRLTK